MSAIEGSCNFPNAEIRFPLNPMEVFLSVMITFAVFKAFAGLIATKASKAMIREGSSAFGFSNTLVISPSASASFQEALRIFVSIHEEAFARTGVNPERKVSRSLPFRSPVCNFPDNIWITCFADS